MSRVGNKPIHLPEGVTVKVDEKNNVVVKGPKGELTFTLNKSLSLNVNEKVLTVSRPNDEIFNRKIHGTSRAILNNNIIGVSKGFEKKLEIKGVGYRAALKGNLVVLSMGYSHPVELKIPKGVSVDIPKNTEITVKGIDKQVVGQFSAQIRAVRKPEPYLGKGIRYVGEYVPRKAGKTAA